MSDWIMGIDPGISGAICLLNTKTKEQKVYDMPLYTVTLKSKKKRKKVDGVGVKQICLMHRIKKCFIEEVGGMPGQGGMTSFNFGHAYGSVLGVLDALGIVYDTIRPQVWKKYYSLAKDKSASISLASELSTNGSKDWWLKKHDGRAEAFLIANYGKEELI